MHHTQSYKSYVGPAALYDTIGAAQFALLYAFGLRSYHKVLDFGCGSLRAGKLLIPYLDAGHYFGIEPQQWLIDACVQEELGEELLRKKQARFSNNADFATDVFGELFDFIIAQSIFSHTGSELYTQAISNMSASLKPQGRILATFFIDEVGDTEQGWFYSKEKPRIFFTETVVRSIAAEKGLSCCALPWYHPRGQTWYVFAKEKALLPSTSECAMLQGLSLYEDEHALPRKGAQ